MTSPARSSKRSAWVDSLLEETKRAPRASQKAIQGLVRRYLPEERDGPAPPRDLEAWLKTMFPTAFRDDFAEHHRELIEWASTIRPHSHPRPYIAIWPRGGGKSTIIEALTIALGAPRPLYEDDEEEGTILHSARDYCLYVSETQGQADEHVQEIANRLESEAITNSYPEFARPRTRRYGDKKSWSRKRLITGTGFIVDALGLNSAGRGAKVEDKRPDLILFDDIDRKFDSSKITRKKETIIKDSIIPMFGKQAAIIGVQNKVIPDGVFSRLADDRADYLMRRHVSGPLPAIRDLKTEKRYDDEAERYVDIITGGEPTWEAGMGIEECQRRIMDQGLSSFLRECQHEVEDVEGALWTSEQLDAVRVSDHPALRYIVVAVDPSGGDAETGIIVAGLGTDGHVYILEDRSMPGDKANAWGRAVADAYTDWQANAVVAEKNQGGNMVRNTIVSAAEGGEEIPVQLVTAKRGKQVRADSAAAAYGDEEIDWQDTRVHHVGTHGDLEQQMTTWVPGNESPDRLDALVYGVKKLINMSTRSQSSIPPSQSH